MRSWQCFMLFLCISSAGAIAPKNNHKALMNQALDSLVRLLPYLSSAESFKVPANEKNIRHNAQALEKIFLEARKDSLLQNDLFSTNNIVILNNLKLAIEGLDSNNKSFAYHRLKETVNLCFHCHIQLPKDFASSFSKGMNNLPKEQFKSDFDYAQYLFLVRNFDEALKYYKNVVKSIGNEIKVNTKKRVSVSLEKQEEYDSALKQILVIYAKIRRDIDEAYTYFKSVDTNDLPSYLKQQILAWNQTLKDWTKHEDRLEDLKDNAGLKKFVNQTLEPLLAKSQEGEAKVIDLLVGSGLLSNYIFSHPQDPDKAIALYYLGLTEASLNNTTFYTLAESYFRDCVVKFPEHEIAPKCYEEYEASVLFGFTGSSGVNLPADVKKDLENLKQMMQKKSVHAEEKTTKP